MAVSYPSLRDGLNLGPPYPEPIQIANNSLVFLNQDSSMGSSYPGIWTTDSFVSGDSDVASRPNRNEMQIQELSLRLGAEIAGPVSIPSFDYHYPSSYLSSYQCESIGLANGSVLHSKYLKLVQMLLDETVNFRKACKQADQNIFQNVCGFDSSNESKENDGQFRNQSVPNPGDSMGNSLEMLSPEEKQDLQNRKTKLLAMLDEVDKRYGQYYHEMQSLISSFEMVAGFGAAKPYTSVALKRLSRNFRSLRDAIKTQVRVTRSRLGEQETSIDDQGERIPRLRYVDQQIRQRRAYHQIGTMRPVWRPPQRGLPENSVSILRAWLFEHFLHPYPKDSEKILLAKQTGLTRNQVANWFINARVRLWKPMIEQMYREEFGDPEMNPMIITSSQDMNERKQQQRDQSSQQELQETATSSSMSPNADEISRSLVGSSNMADYHYMVVGMAAHHHQDRFADPRQFHDFVV